MPDGGELAAVSALGVAPWAGGDRVTYVRIIASEVTGRRIRGTTSGTRAERPGSW